MDQYPTSLIELVQQQIDPNTTSSAVSPYSYLLEGSNIKVLYVRLEHFRLDNFKASLKILRSNHDDLIILFEDVFKQNPTKIIERLKYHAQISNRIHGRDTTVKKINKLQAVQFLEENHTNVPLKAKYNLGLFDKRDELVAVGSFGQIITMRNNAKSSELIRFCTKKGTRVVGGLSKLISHYQKENQLDELMSYCDLDWSTGKSYVELGFKFIETIPPTRFVVHLPTLERWHEKRFKQLFNPTKLNFDEYRTVENSGSIKYIKYF